MYALVLDFKKNQASSSVVCTIVCNEGEQSERWCSEMVETKRVHFVYHF